VRVNHTSYLYCLFTCNAHAIAILLHGYCAMYPPPPPTSILYAIQHTILAMAISCKGQALMSCTHGRTTTTRGVCLYTIFWPIQDVLLLRGFCAQIKHPYAPPRPPALATLPQYYCTTIGQCTTPPRPPCCMPYTIQDW